jgi:16S rRNA (guanine(1405)-N(7))-methyltransferase
MMGTNLKEIDAVVNEIKSGKKYKFLCPDTIRHVVGREIGRHKSLKETVKAAKKRLHLILADYLSQLNDASAAKQLKAAFSSGDREEIDQTCRDIMSKHASTRERLDILEEFYLKLFDITGKPAKLADLACALNPFSFRWMGLPKDIAYYAFDNNMQTVELLNLYFHLEGLGPPAKVRDILCQPPEGFFDVALLFKMYHCLEHRQKGAGWEVIEKTPAKWLAVSFPTRNLANRKVDIFANYKEDMLARVKQKGWRFQVLEFRTELVLLIYQF